MSAAGAWADPDEAVSRLRAGDLRIAGRLISRIEQQATEIGPVLAALHRAGRTRRIVGLTGAPGAGKSSLIDQLIALWRARDERVAILAVDPSSPLSGGAILGDRVRMARHNTDAGVFIRSMSARGHLGGLSARTAEALTVLEAMPFERILVETVGAGQNEIDIRHHAHSVVVVQTPASGDGVQTLKAGLLEIADIYVLNHRDLPGADRAASRLEELAHSRLPDDGSPPWMAPVIKTQATTGAGVDDLDRALQSHAAWLDAHPAADARRQRQRTRAVLIARMTELLWQRHGHAERSDPAFERWIDDILARRSDPATAAAELLR